MKKTINGITLISVIITIIVLLILAGISIALGIGENGIIEQTQNAEYNYGASNARKYLEYSRHTVIATKEGSNITLDEYLDYLRTDERIQILNKISSTKAYVRVDKKYVFLLNEENNSLEFILTEEKDLSSESIDQVISFSNIQWNDGKASVVVTKNTEDYFNMEYRILDENLDLKKDYAEIKSGDRITDLNLNETLEVRLTDGKDYTKAATLTITDSTKPKITLEQIITDVGQITITANTTDEESGFDENTNYYYYIKLNSEAEYPSTEYQKTTSNTITFLDLGQNATYDIKVTIKDRAGNEGIVEKKSITTKSVTSAASAIQFGNINWSNEKANVRITKITNDSFDIQYKILNKNSDIIKDFTPLDNNGIISELNSGEIIEVRLVKGNNYGSTTRLEIIDSITPNISLTQTVTNIGQITITANATDEESGLDENANYYYYIKLSSQLEYPATEYQKTTSNTITFSELEQNVSYDIKVTIKDQAGNEGIVEKKSIITKSVTSAASAIQFGNINWSNGKANVKITKITNDSFNIQYRILNQNLDVIKTFTSINNNETITGLNSGEIIEVRLVYGKYYGSTMNLNIIDSTQPKITLSQTNIGYYNISVSLVASDNESGIGSNVKYNYFIKPSTSANFPTTPTASTTSTTYTFNNLTHNTNYDILVSVTDIAGNTGFGELKNIKTNKYITIAYLKETQDTVDNNTTLDDGKGGKITIPIASTVAPDSSIYVSEGIVVITPDGSEWVWVPVNDITKMAKKTSGTDKNGLDNYQGRLYNGTNEYSSYGQGSTSRREPSLVTGNTADSYAILNSITGTSFDAKSNYYKDILGYNSAIDFGKDMQADFNEMVAKVDLYKGFYVARYETSLSSSGIAQSKKGYSPTSAETVPNKYWYGLYKIQKNYAVANGWTPFIGSSMIWGCQYDQMLLWMNENKVKISSTTPVSDTDGNGTIRNRTSICGGEIDDKLNNVYDLLGNRRELTLEASGQNNRVRRSGDNDTERAINSRDNTGSTSFPTYSGSFSGSRMTFYLK